MGNSGVLRCARWAALAGAFLALDTGRAAADGAHVIGVSDLQGATDWSGLYVGGQVGGTWSSADWTLTNPNFPVTPGPPVFGAGSGPDGGGALGGVLVGYNQQVGHWVFGLELAASAASGDLAWLASIAGRVGYAWDCWLVYGRGGWASGDVDLRLNAPAVSASKETWAHGWTLGAGAEYMLWKGVAVGLAYDYAELSVHDEPVSCPLCGPGGVAPVLNGDIAVQSVMARLSFLLTPED